jgi:5-methylcytosine-specific restriction endonuclease McrA
MLEPTNRLPLKCFFCISLSLLFKGAACLSSNKVDRCMSRLSWNGNLSAQRAADAAWAAVAPKNRRKKSKRKKPVVTNKTKRPPQKLNYYKYISSKAWRRKREEAFNHHGRKCQRCRSIAKLRVHHKHYRSLGREKMTDLEILCDDCHSLHHEDIGGIDSLSKEFRAIVS